MKNKLFEDKPFESRNVFALPAETVVEKEAGRFKISHFNLILLILMVALAIWYALWTNLVISGQYHEKLSKEKLENLIAESNQLWLEKSSSANLGALLVFAKASGLVEQRNIEYLFYRHNVAEVPRDLTP